MQRKVTDNTTELFHEFIETRKHKGLSPASIKSYEFAFETFMKHSDGELCEKSLFQMMDALQEKGSGKSVNFHLTQLRTFINYCSSNGYIKPFKVQLQKQQEAPIVFYSDEEVTALLKKPDRKDSFRDWRTYTQIAFMLATGCRLGTLINIHLQDIDFDSKEVIYRHLKTKEFAIIPLSDSILSILRTYLRMWDVKDYLFCDYSNKKMTENSVRQSITDYCKKRGVEDKGVHSFRRTFARNYIINGGDPFSLQRILCHKDLSMTEHYVRLFGNDLRGKIDVYCPLDKFNKPERIGRKWSIVSPS